MTEHDARASGSRWEPTAAEGNPAADRAAMPAYATPVAQRLPARLRRRVMTGAAALALVAAGGAGGFAMGQATSPGDSTVDSTVPDDDDGFRGDRPDVESGRLPGSTATPGVGSSATDGDTA